MWHGKCMENTWKWLNTTWFLTCLDVFVFFEGPCESGRFPAGTEDSRRKSGRFRTDATRDATRDDPKEVPELSTSLALDRDRTGVMLWIGWTVWSPSFSMIQKCQVTAVTRWFLYPHLSTCKLQALFSGLHLNIRSGDEIDVSWTHLRCFVNTHEFVQVWTVCLGQIKN